MFGSLLLGLTLTTPAQAADQADFLPAALVGDGDAVAKKRAKSGGGSAEKGESRSGPGRKLDTERDGGRSITRSGSDSGEGSEERRSSREGGSDRHESADRRESADRHESADRRRSGGERRESADTSASSRHRSSRHETRSHVRAGGIRREFVIQGIQLGDHLARFDRLAEIDRTAHHLAAHPEAQARFHAGAYVGRKLQA